MTEDERRRKKDKLSPIEDRKEVKRRARERAESLTRDADDWLTQHEAVLHDDDGLFNAMSDGETEGGPARTLLFADWSAGEQPHEQLNVVGDEDLRGLQISEGDRGIGGTDPDARTSRDALNKNLPAPAATRPGAHEGHHIIPWELREHAAVYEYDRLKGVDNPRANVAGRAINSKDNGIALPANATLASQEGLPMHKGSHPHYTGWVEIRLDQLWAEYNYTDMEPSEFGRRYEGLIGEFKTRLNNNKLDYAKVDGVRKLR